MTNKMITSFQELKVKDELIAYLKQQGITKPTPVQAAVIPKIRSGEDVVVQAQTGTGKTLAFLLPIMEKVKPHAPAVQALVVAPTRELALQITLVAQNLGGVLGVNAITVYGGQDLTRQEEKLAKHPQIVVGTPGRILDFIRRNVLQLDGVNKVVLDEADQMLAMGFLEDVEAILRHTAADRQTMFFSATIPERIRALSRRYMHAPQDVKIAAKHITLKEIEQIVVDTAEGQKLDRLCAMINEYQPYLAMVFCHTKQRAHQLATDLAQRGYLVDELHGDLTQAKRKLVLRRFAEAKLQILAATDIAARGLDVEGVTHVFNYDIPHDAETYIHRIGRTGRAGEKGKAITFVNSRQYDYLRLIEKGIQSRIAKEESVRVKKEPPKPKQQAAEEEKKAKPLSKYAYARKGQGHGGTNLRSRRQKSRAASVGGRKAKGRKKN